MSLSGIEQDVDCSIEYDNDIGPCLSKHTSVDSDHHYWESQLRLGLADISKVDEKKFRYFDDKGIFNFLFLLWVGKWTRYISSKYVEPYKLHPLPLSDQILYWQPIFSKHVSDGLFRLESCEADRANCGTGNKKLKPFKSILIRAIVLTFWKRALLGLSGIVIMNILGMSAAILVNELLKRLSKKTFDLVPIFLFIGFIAVIEPISSLFIDHFTFYLYRLAHIIQYSFSITVFQHGICYRRNYYNQVNGTDNLNMCNSVVHSCSGNSPCSKNPLLCSAQRYQNKELTPRIFSFEFIDSYYISLFFESLMTITQFLCNFVYGTILIHRQININVWPLFLVCSLFVLLMIVVEIINTFILKYVYALKDYRIAKCSETISGLHLIKKMLLDDVGHNAITEARNDELNLVILRLFMSFTNKILFTLTITIMFLVILNDFVEQLKKVSNISEINTHGLLAMLYVLLKIIYSISLLPHAIKHFTTAITSYSRISDFIKDCSPNFYISDNKFTGTTEMSVDKDKINYNIPEDVMIIFNGASFTWLHSRQEVLNPNKDQHVNLRDVDFVLKKGTIAIVTGAQGSGKTNFVKAILGDMTLVEGSMAVLPLSTNMPIFYASQDVWLQKGTIRSNITFGHRFDEELYNTVIKAVELEHDISTWEGGDMRKISEHGYSLSGGQRVRVGLARAIYAYLIFSKTNGEENNSKHSFLVVLDDSFTGLDPFVAKTIFKNLFNFNDGLLVKDDVSIVFTTSKRILDICVSSDSPDSFADISLYSIENKRIKSIGNILSFIKNKEDVDEEPVGFDLSSKAVLKNDLFGVENVIKMCESDSFTRLGRRNTVKQNYNRHVDDPKHNFDKGKKKSHSSAYRTYLIYFSAVWIPFAIFIFLTFVSTILDNIKFIFSSDLSDYIKERTTDVTTLSDLMKNHVEVKDYSDKTLKTITWVSVLVIAMSLCSMIVLTFSCIIASRKIHEYCVNSIINRRANEVKTHRTISDIITFLSSDIFLIDESLGYAISTTLVSLVETIIHLLTLCFLFPIYTLLFLVACFIIFKYIFIRYISASKNLQLAVLESTSHINSVCDSTIFGSSVYRSFKKEWEFLHSVIEHTEYNMRCNFLNKAILTWASIRSKFYFYTMNVFVLVLPVIHSRLVDKRLHLGYYGLAISLSMIVTHTFTNFMVSVARMETLMCSMKRFESFIPTGSKCTFEKRKNIHEEDLIINLSSNDSYIDKISSAEGKKSSLIKRRNMEYLSSRKTCYRFASLLFNPKINIVDVSQHISSYHVGVQLQNVFVYTSSANFGSFKGTILNNITATACASDIIGIIGRTGAGKTTLLSVLQNLAENRQGSVLLDGCDLNDIPSTVTRQIIGVLPQLPFVFRGWTVRRFIDPRKLFDDTDIESALDSCGLLKFVKNLPGGRGLDTVIIPECIDDDVPKYIKRRHSGGSNNTSTFSSHRSLTLDNLDEYYSNCNMMLSSTQLRTLSLARLVLYRHFYRLILVDEPPSENCNDINQNGANEVGIPIYELLKRYFRHCTTFITAHDANALKMCTSVWILHNGCLIGTCNRDDILFNESISKIIEKNKNLTSTT
ncbi:ABC transporter, ATP-binding protein domain containing protein [Theileria equi strain WA]|uniref:ABC transporter, ATP-binding protein domain containing protein n=1 Tax=Theileria equi strain WA TaxID=1537102 RepID=L0AW74_THEEQ|nr:ABC transporter, ATP-binding protein domain containing protein [Theileria equi strain WA]AFZ79281.1 ABC transporter, ATP-binding protein domain containing protein [Theileria equi strain WA]|eukprot:XP_004828947.1 ABC transporter, ATP-binding protein domain containing protein [Theileria equi strain WA]